MKPEKPEDHAMEELDALFPNIKNSILWLSPPISAAPFSLHTSPWLVGVELCPGELLRWPHGELLLE
jgi:hypothetical protein